jgi:hypothetical protein
MVQLNSIRLDCTPLKVGRKFNLVNIFKKNQNIKSNVLKTAAFSVRFYTRSGKCSIFFKKPYILRSLFSVKILLVQLEKLYNSEGKQIHNFKTCVNNIQGSGEFAKASNFRNLPQHLFDDYKIEACDEACSPAVGISSASDLLGCQILYLKISLKTNSCIRLNRSGFYTVLANSIEDFVSLQLLLSSLDRMSPSVGDIVKTLLSCKSKFPYVRESLDSMQLDSAVKITRHVKVNYTGESTFEAGNYLSKLLNCCVQIGSQQFDMPTSKQVLVLTDSVSVVNFMDYRNFENDLCSKCVADLIPAEHVSELIDFCDVVEGVSCENGFSALKVVLEPLFNDFCKFSILQQIESLLCSILGGKVYMNVHKYVTALVTLEVGASTQEKCQPLLKSISNHEKSQPSLKSIKVEMPVANASNCVLDLMNDDDKSGPVHHRMLSPFDSLLSSFMEESKPSILNLSPTLDNNTSEEDLQGVNFNTSKELTESSTKASSFDRDNFTPILGKCRNLSEDEEEEDDESICDSDDVSDHTPPPVKKRKNDMKLPKLDLITPEDDYQKLLHGVQQKFISWTSKIDSSSEKFVSDVQRMHNEMDAITNKMKKLSVSIEKFEEKHFSKIGQKMDKFSRDFTSMQQATIDKIAPECRDNTCKMHFMSCISKVIEPPRGHITGQLNKKKGVNTKNKLGE